jgi:hypothetical protein
MSDQSFPPRMFKGLSDANYTVEIGYDPSLAQEINQLFAGKKGGSAFRKLAELIPGTELCIIIPERHSSAWLPCARYGFQVGPEAEWKSPLLIESLVYEYIAEVAACPNAVVCIATMAMSQAAPQNEAARTALARLLDPTLASVLAIAHRKHILQVFASEPPIGASSPVMVPVELIVLHLLTRRFFDIKFSKIVCTHKDNIHKLAFQETIQEIAPGIGFRVAPFFTHAEEGQITELQKKYVAEAWYFSQQFLNIIDNRYPDHSQVRKSWRKASSLLNQIDSLTSQTADSTSIPASAQSPILKRWVNSYKWSLSWGIVALVVALVLQVNPLFNVGDSFILSVLISTLALAAAAPIVFHILDGLGYYSLMAIAAVFGSLWSIVDTAMGDRTIHDQTTWIWLFVGPLMVIYEIFRDRAVKDVQTEEWRKGVI